MRLAPYLLILGLFFVTTTSLSTPAPQGLPKCEPAKVQYSAFDPSYSNRILVESVDISEKLPRGMMKQYSPQHTSWQARVEPNYANEGPWTTTIYLDLQEAQPPLKITFVNHANGGAEIQWMNEKLIFGRVWWGRIVSTDFIFDASTREFIYREMAQYKAMLAPCP
jgi:hypothetical protein